MKYIVMRVMLENSQFEMPFTFPDMINHDQYFEQMQHMLLMNHSASSEIVSAGFCNFFTSQMQCSGRSETLNIESRLNVDDMLLQNFNYNQGLIL